MMSISCDLKVSPVGPRFTAPEVCPIGNESRLTRRSAPSEGQQAPWPRQLGFATLRIAADKVGGERRRHVAEDTKGPQIC
jgi:hypothetical protein